MDSTVQYIYQRLEAIGAKISNFDNMDMEDLINALQSENMNSPYYNGCLEIATALRATDGPTGMTMIVNAISRNPSLVDVFESIVNEIIVGDEYYDTQYDDVNNDYNDSHQTNPSQSKLSASAPPFVPRTSQTASIQPQSTRPLLSTPSRTSQTASIQPQSSFHYQKP